MPYPDQIFDYVVTDQVLEHVAGPPQEAVNESYRVLKPGGWAIHATVLACGSYAPGFSRIIECGGWGNPYVWLLAACDLLYEGIPHAPWHPLHKLATRQHPNWPIVTWVVAEK